jgi:uncharacterized protein
MGFGFDPLYFVFLIPAMLLALWAQSKVKGTVDKYSQVPTRRGVTGLDTARIIMGRYGLQHVKVEQIGGFMTDHYDPRGKKMALSQASVHNSIASVAIVAHELGHAMQDHENYAMLKLRGAIVPAVQVGGWLGPIMLMVGALLQSPSLIWIGIIGFAIAAFFALVTLPVEFDASNRALRFLDETGVLDDAEMKGAKKVLDAAALTYVAAATQAVLTLLYYLIRFAGLGRSRDE